MTATVTVSVISSIRQSVILLWFYCSYSSTDKVCSFPHENGTTHLDDVNKMDAQSGYDTVYFTGMQVLYVYKTVHCTDIQVLYVTLQVKDSNTAYNIK